jgi:hypothetical protein
MDKSQPGQQRHGDYPLGAKGTSVKPVTPKKVVKDLTKVLDRAFDKEKSVKEGIMDVVKQTFNDNVAGWPMGTSDEQFIQGWARDIKARTGKTIPVEKLAQLYNNYVKRSGELMQSHGTTNEEQDACYRKVKSRYKVWPSAYASGALVQCRKKGAANWGNKKK